MLLVRHKWSLLMTLSSFAALAVLMTTTDPANNIIYAAFFFALAFVFLLSLGNLIVRLQTGQMTTKNRSRIVAVSLILLTLLMFRSAQSLNLIGGLILLLISFGLVFYISRR